MDELQKHALEQQLELLNERMKETADTGNQFLTRFHFGGIVAVIALLNVDLVLIGKPDNVTLSYFLILLSIAIFLLILSFIYFCYVTNHYRGFRESHRKLKYKYELTLHAMLSGATAAEYACYLEKGLNKCNEPKDPDYPGSPDQLLPFIKAADYLYEHHAHRLKYKTNTIGKGYLYIAMLLVALTILIRLAGISAELLAGFFA